MNNTIQNPILSAFNPEPSILRVGDDYYIAPAAAVHQRLTLPSGKQLAAVVTEAYGPCNHPDHAEVDWTEYKHWNAAALGIFAQYPFAGLTLSNHAEPVFSLWEDVAWQQQGTQRIHQQGQPIQAHNANRGLS